MDYLDRDVQNSVKERFLSYQKEGISANQALQLIYLGIVATLDRGQARPEPPRIVPTDYPMILG